MTQAEKAPAVSLMSIRSLVLVALLVGATLFHVRQKVEMADVGRRINTAELHLRELGQERTKLLAGISFKKEPAFIETIAIGLIGMVYPGHGEVGTGIWHAREID